MKNEAVMKVNSVLLRYYKKKQKYTRVITRKQKQQLQGKPDDVFTELETQLAEAEQNYLTSDSKCQCKICSTQQIHTTNPQDLYLSTASDSYLSLFTLLQHLTMIEADEAPKILGQLLIPMLFFKRQFQHQKQLECNRYRPSKFVKHPIQNSQSFILFKSNIHSGYLSYPTIIKSLESVAFQIQLNEQLIRKKKQQQQFGHFIKIHQIDESTKLVHKSTFDQSIPSFKLPWANSKDYPSAIKSYIIHQQDQYMQSSIKDCKMSKSQAFCLLRYNLASKNSDKIGKYQIFTLQTFQIYLRNRRKVGQVNHMQNNKLNLAYIESYTRTRPHEQPKRRSNMKTNNECMQNKLQMIYFTEFNQQNQQICECPLYKFAELEVLTKSGKISRIDPAYLDHISLEQGISDLLNINSPPSTCKYLTISLYKHYKMVHVLGIVCRVKVRSLKLKWILNDNNELVLIECIEYLINRQKSLLPKPTNAHVEHIVDNGLSFLNQNLQINDIDIMFKKKQNIDEIISMKMQEKKIRMIQKQQWERQENSRNGIRKISRSMPLRPIVQKIKKQYQSQQQHSNMAKNKIRPNLVSWASSLNPFLAARNRIRSLSSSKSILPLSRSCHISVNNSRASQLKMNYNTNNLRKSYKLRAFKTLANSPNKDS